MMDDRAATETLGFVLAFALVTTSIGIVYTAGFGGLQDARNAEQVNNVERAFDVLGENFEELRHRGVPSRSTEIKLLRGSLQIASPITITVNVSGVANTSVTAHPRPISYSTPDDSTGITYEAGGVFRTDDGNTVMLSPPSWMISPGNRLIIPVVDTTRSSGQSMLSGRQTILLVAQFQNRNVFQYRAATGTETVNITIDSPRAAAWSRYFERNGFTAVDGDPSDNQIEYSISVQRVYVIQTAVGVRLSS